MTTVELLRRALTLATLFILGTIGLNYIETLPQLFGAGCIFAACFLGLRWRA